MTPQRLAAGYSLATRFGPNGAPANYDIGADGRIARTLPLGQTLPNRDNAITPGLVDIQVNGFAGVDFNAPGINAGRMDIALSAMLASGVTRCLPTLITASTDELVSLLQALDMAVSESRLGPVMVPGYHIEGPFMSPEDGYVGAHPREHMRAGSPDLVLALEAVSSRPIKLMTVAPEVDGVMALIPFLAARGIACAIGHSAASRAQIDAAIAAGATLSTHLGNGLPHMLNKNESSLLVQLGRDQLMASFIADGIHIPRDILQSWLRAKTLGRALIVTDAASAAGAPGVGGTFSLGHGIIERHLDGSVRLPGSSYLAGSAASMDEMVRNLMSWYGFGLDEIVTLAHDNPLRAIGMPAINPQTGGWSDFVEWEMREGQAYVRKAYIGPWYIQGVVNTPA